MTTTDIDELMTVAEVREKCKICRSKIYAIISRRELPAVRIGRAVRVYRRDVERYLAENPY